MTISLAKVISQTIEEKYEQQGITGTEINLIQNEGNAGGHCERRFFKKELLYKVIFPTPLSSLDHFMSVAVTVYEGGASHYMDGEGIYPDQNHGSILTIYDECSVHFCFFRFLRDIECSFFTNLH